MSSYKWVRTPDGEKLFSVGILNDGTLHNPNGYPDEVVRVAVLAADERRHQRRSRAAKKAAETKAVRRTLNVQRIAKRVIAEQATGPRRRCYVCDKKLTDNDSIARGIGPECWQDVLDQIAIGRAAAVSVSVSP